MTREEKKACTYIGSAEIRKENTTRRDALVAAAKKAGFTVECTEAIPISLSCEPMPEIWTITVYKEGRLDRIDTQLARRDLSAAWRGL